ncbi:hypothetical protein GCWU000325_00628 [Alloprevotella tannerae ATCC 51259]|uniref:Uncharacterized protein n=1 Tax=Alloprevotella tannerae ATCC 51259 TaxID=626522 RepID=C9LEJ8_9BACT|nr:hypothetical protein GCWU000325_00628 [Alloprevotella tannerae ATCC 51259]
MDEQNSVLFFCGQDFDNKRLARCSSPLRLTDVVFYHDKKGLRSR